jgi:hypothetical protein
MKQIDYKLSLDLSMVFDDTNTEGINDIDINQDLVSELYTLMQDAVIRHTAPMGIKVMDDAGNDVRIGVSVYAIDGNLSEKD